MMPINSIIQSYTLISIKTITQMSTTHLSSGDYSTGVHKGKGKVPGYSMQSPILEFSGIVPEGGHYF